MVNGFYGRTGLQIAIYETNGQQEYNAFVVITNEEHPNEPIVLTGEKAISLMKTISDHLDEFDKEES